MGCGSLQLTIFRTIFYLKLTLPSILVISIGLFQGLVQETREDEKSPQESEKRLCTKTYYPIANNESVIYDKPKEIKDTMEADVVEVIINQKFELTYKTEGLINFKMILKEN